MTNELNESSEGINTCLVGDCGLEAVVQSGFTARHQQAVDQQR